MDGEDTLVEGGEAVKVRPARARLRAAEAGPVVAETSLAAATGADALSLTRPQLLSGDLGQGRELALHFKDGGYVLAAGEARGDWSPITALTHGMAAGQGEHHASGVVRVYEARMGARVVGSEPATFSLH